MFVEVDVAGRFVTGTAVSVSGIGVDVAGNKVAGMVTTITPFSGFSVVYACNAMVSGGGRVACSVDPVYNANCNRINGMMETLSPIINTGGVLLYFCVINKLF